MLWQFPDHFKFSKTNLSRAVKLCLALRIVVAYSSRTCRCCGRRGFSLSFQDESKPLVG